VIVQEDQGLAWTLLRAMMAKRSIETQRAESIAFSNKGRHVAMCTLRLRDKRWSPCGAASMKLDLREYFDSAVGDGDRR
jgi:hypothetical protein